MLFHESKTSKVTSLKDANFHPLANLFTICWKRNAETCSPLQSVCGACNSIYTILQKLLNVKNKKTMNVLLKDMYNTWKRNLILLWCVSALLKRILMGCTVQALNLIFTNMCTYKQPMCLWDLDCQWDMYTAPDEQNAKG